MFYYKTLAINTLILKMVKTLKNKKCKMRFKF